MARRGAVRAGGSAVGPVVALNIKIEGLEKTDAAFKATRRDVNTALRDAQEKVGERVVLPLVKSRLGAIAGAWSQTMYVKRDRLDVFIGSRLKRSENRALGWLDFGGQRENDTRRRVGPHILANTLEQQQPRVREAIGDAVLDEFREHGFEVS